MENLSYYEDEWVELLDGRIVAMSPRPAVNHNIVVTNITHIFRDYLKGKQCKVFSDGLDVYLTKKDRVIPDVMIVCNSDIIRQNGIHGAPDLVVEILSPSTVKRDRGYKKNLYENSGVREYWLVDIANRSVEVYLLKDGLFVLDEIYAIFPDYLIEKMTEEEKSSIIHEFKTSLFSDMIITLEDVFEGVFYTRV